MLTYFDARQLLAVMPETPPPAEVDGESSSAMLEGLTQLIERVGDELLTLTEGGLLSDQGLDQLQTVRRIARQQPKSAIAVWCNELHGVNRAAERLLYLTLIALAPSQERLNDLIVELDNPVVWRLEFLAVLQGLWAHRALFSEQTRAHLRYVLDARQKYVRDDIAFAYKQLLDEVQTQVNVSPKVS